jgi:CheY-like chemotaxis protein
VAVRCVIVDDNAPFLRAARDLLEGEGISVVGVASTTAEALRVLDDVRPDVVLVDIDLGQENGFDLARRLANEQNGDGWPVILISTYAARDIAELVAASPALGFLSKSELSGRAISDLLGGTTADHERLD